MRKRLATCIIVGLTSAALPTIATAQSDTGIAGVVRDGSGAVMPGVTVEAASPALIEKVRSTVSDGQGQYKIVDLRPGVYSVTFTLTGFSTFKRDGVDLPPGFTATVNGEMRVGTLEETITVSGQAPTVDVQSTRSQQVLGKEVMDSIPSTFRLPTSYVASLPGIVSSVIGNLGSATGSMTIHGSSGNASNVLINGFKTTNPSSGGGGNFIYYVNMAYVQEVAVALGGESAESAQSGVKTNIIPKAGGNRFTANSYFGWGDKRFASDNLTDDLKATGLTAVNGLNNIYDIQPSWGGPVTKDKLWFYNSYRYGGASDRLANLYVNKTPTAWTYTPDMDRQAIGLVDDRAAGLRLTWQATQKHKFTMFYDFASHCACRRNFNSIISSEATQLSPFYPNHWTDIFWTHTATSKLLLEAGVNAHWGSFNTNRQRGIDVGFPDEQTGVALDAISVVEQGGDRPGLRYRASGSYGQNYSANYLWRAAATYVTGTHFFKMGIDDLFAVNRVPVESGAQQMNYRFRDGVPNQVTFFAYPQVPVGKVNADLGIFVQDRWTMRQLTLNLGLRYDYYNASVPAQDQADLLAKFGLWNPIYGPVRSFPEVKEAPLYHDLSPRLGGSYDLFGNGKTAVKGSVGRFVDQPGLAIASANNPLNTSVNSATRTWNDANRNYVVDCDVLNPIANGECTGPISNVNFGQLNPNANRYSDQARTARNYNWEFEATVQHELRQGLSVSGGYYRRWFGNFRVTENTATAATDYDPYCITTPVDPRLPGGGGQQLCGFYDVNPSKSGQVNNLVIMDAGRQEEVYDGYSLTLNARLPGQGTLRGGLDSGRTRTNTCFTMNHPELSGNVLYPALISPHTSEFCDIRPPMRPQVKFIGVKPLPWYGIQVSATYQNLPPGEINANWVVSSAQIAPSLGRPLTAGANSNVTLNILPPGTNFGPRMQLLDLSVSKRTALGPGSATATIDVFNVFNSSAVSEFVSAYGSTWQQATNIVRGRWIKFNVLLDF